MTTHFQTWLARQCQIAGQQATVEQVAAIVDAVMLNVYAADLDRAALIALVQECDAVYKEIRERMAECGV
jgi:hypothetical protein